MGHHQAADSIVVVLVVALVYIMVVAVQDKNDGDNDNGFVVTVVADIRGAAVFSSISVSNQLGRRWD